MDLDFVFGQQIIRIDTSDYTDTVKDRSMSASASGRNLLNPTRLQVGPQLRNCGLKELEGFRTYSSVSREIVPHLGLYNGAVRRTIPASSEITYKA